MCDECGHALWSVFVQGGSVLEKGLVRRGGGRLMMNSGASWRGSDDSCHAIRKDGTIDR